LFLAFLGAPYLECSNQLGVDLIELNWYKSDSNITMDAWEFEIYPFEAEQQKTVI